MEKKKKIIIVIIVAIIAVVSVGSYFAYEIYMDSKYDEAYKLRSNYAVNSLSYLNESNVAMNNTALFYQNTTDYFNNIFYSLDLAIESTQKAINYSEEMNRTATSKVEKEYAQAQIKEYKTQLKRFKEIKNEFTKLKNDLNYQFDSDKLLKLKKEYENSANSRHEILLKNPEFEKRIKKLYNETTN